MSEVKEQGNSEDNPKGGGLIPTFLENAVTKGGESIGELAVNSLVKYAQDKYQKALLLTGEAFNRYLTNSINRLNQIKTIATGGQTRSIMGSGSIYVEVGVSHRNDTIPTNTVNPLLDVKTHILIEGTGGAGKSMLMRYLFLKTAEQGDYLPVFLNLRQISRQKSGEISILSLIHDSLKDYDREFGNAILWEQFVYSLNHGKYLFLMDGFDEIKESMAIEAAEKIQKFCAEFPWNACIITTRPEARTEPLETFETMRSLPLNKSQAIELVKKIWDEDEQTLEFCRQLEESLFDDGWYNSFASNPLLLSMMGLTFLNHNFIPDNLKEFYEKAFETLYSLHDAKNKGAYRREFECGLNSEDNFKRIFSRFCFQTYLKSEYEFTKGEIILRLQSAIQKSNLAGISAEKYLYDLQRAVCMIIRNGNVYQFAHRSFQAYFAAVYTSSLGDSEQKVLLKSLMIQKRGTYDFRDYYTLTNQIESFRFLKNALEEGLRNFQKCTDNTSNPNIFFLKSIFCGLTIPSQIDSLSFWVEHHCNTGMYYEYSLYSLFTTFVTGKFTRNDNEIKKRGMIVKYLKQFIPFGSFDRFISFDEIDDSKIFMDRDRNIIYSTIFEYLKIPETREAIRKWLAELDAKRAAQKTDTLDDLIDSL